MTAPARRVLVIEDDDTMREVIGEVMADEGYDVRLAADGREGLAALQSWDADLVLLDLMMPLMDGAALRRHQREGAIGHGAKVVLISAARNLEETAREIEADGWLAKPFTLEAMTGMVRQLLAES